jgi:N-acetylmuramoyl-L-alanine amidase
MRSFGRAAAVCVLLMVVASAVDVSAQGVDAIYADLLTREKDLRREMDLAPQMRAQPPGEASSALLKRVRTAVTSYENLAKRFPRSGYSDNALLQAAVLSADAYWQFGDSRDRTNALRLFDQLKKQFPTSSLVAQITGQTSRLNGGQAQNGPAPATLKTIRREVLPDAVRVTLELEREAVFYDEQTDSPPRVFVDLRNTQPVDALAGASIDFPDDVVRQARVGIQPDKATRIVFDLQGATRHSVYSLYNPYRVVIDFERTTATTTTGTTKVTTNTKDTKTGAAKNIPTLPPPSAAATNVGGGFSLSRQLGLGISRVVIDPGHGGHDPGAQIKGQNEADLVLDIALRLEKLLLKEPGVDVVLTRRSDVYVPLEERTAIANRSKADLFLSIHTNAIANQTVRGFETYFLNFAANPEAEALAARENAGSARTMGNLPDIVKAIALNNKIDESRDFAGMVQTSMQDRLRKADKTTRNLGVKQAPFMVLIGATMPSALAEVSFLSNKDEASLLKTQSYRQEIAQALLGGIMKYQSGLKKVPAGTVLRSTF